MSHILHLGHQVTDLAGIEGRISADAAGFDADLDVNCIKITTTETASVPFSASWGPPTGDALREVVAANADSFAQGLRHVVAAIRADGHTTLRSMARELNRRGMVTRRGGKWHVSTVRNLLVRVQDAATGVGNP